MYNTEDKPFKGSFIFADMKQLMLNPIWPGQIISGFTLFYFLRHPPSQLARKCCDWLINCS